MILLCIIAFGLASVFFGARAQSNDRGLIINGVIELSADGATVFYWVLFCLSVGFVLMTAALIFHRLTYRQRIAFTQSSIIVPKSRWSKEEHTIKYSEIKSITASKVNSQRFLNVIFAGGKFTIASSMLPSKTDFDEAYELLAKKVRNV
jgi:hypothetical protein